LASHRRNRVRRLGRREPSHEPKQRILIVCEGTRTEPQYLQRFERACQNSRFTIRIAREHGVPKTLVTAAKDRKRLAEADASRQGDENPGFDSVWCVFDVDEHHYIPDVLQMARDNGIELAISNPCFELWLLLHFRESPGAQLRARIHEMLSSYVRGGYNKVVEFTEYSAGYPRAVARAKRMDETAQSCGKPGQNPTTGVYRLTELIRGEAGTSR
jgi:hypothetical protein